MPAQIRNDFLRSTILRWLSLFAILVLGCGGDQVSKSWARESLPGNPTTVVPQVLEFRYAENRAIAFSIFHDLPDHIRTPLIFTMAGGAFLFLVILIWKSRHQELFHLLPLILILAGAVGNLLDRFVHGFVIDFVRVHWGNAWSFPIFNVADALITVGGALLLALALFRPGKEDGGNKDETPMEGEAVATRAH